MGLDPTWYKDAVIYQLHVKTFHDSDGDGIGDFPGLTQKLDYLKALGVTAIWLLPFYPSPLKDDGYDIADYYSIHPSYGTLKDFKEFLRQAHRRDLKVISELVINHTSSDHAWFQRARRAKPGSSERNYYVWSETPNRFHDARIIFGDFEASNWAWDPVANAYYWHRFYSHQPDLNFDHPPVQKEIFRMMDFWFGMGVDGMRLDAIPYLFEREGTNCENLPETHAFLAKLRAHVDRRFSGKMFLAEANQWPEDAVAYFGKGDECQMAFHFPLMPRMYMALQMEDRYPILDILEQTPALPEGCQWGIFLRNHDELTLEMVTDEERDYMYRSFVKDPRMKINLGIRRRLVPLLDNNRRKVELMNILLFSLPGSPIIYYGDEIGMGDNYYLGDRDGVRTPMQWSSDRNAGFSRANPQQLLLPVIIDSEYHYETVNVETQERNVSSLLWWMRRVIEKRKKYKAFSRGSLTFLPTDNSKVLTFLRQHEEQTILVIINLSRFSQVVELNLVRFRGFVPEEVFGRTKFPRIREGHYLITLNPHGHFWFELKDERKTAALVPQAAYPYLEIQEGWRRLLEGRFQERFEREVLLEYLPKCRWFGAKARVIQNITIVERYEISLPDKCQVVLLMLEVSFLEGAPMIYALPVTFVAKENAALQVKEAPLSILAEVHVAEGFGYLCDANYAREFHRFLFDLIAKGRSLHFAKGVMVGYVSRAFKAILKGEAGLASEVLRAEQSNTAVIFEHRYFLKMFRKVDEGLNPDVEIGRYLSEENGFSGTPAFVGAVELRRLKKPAAALCLMQELVRNEGDAWKYVLGQLKNYYEGILASPESAQPQVEGFESRALLEMRDGEVPSTFQQKAGAFYLEMVSLLGTRTAQMHMALASHPGRADFSPEPFSMLYQRSVYQGMQGMTNKVMADLRRSRGKLHGQALKDAEWLIRHEEAMIQHLKMILFKKFSLMKARIHGDYHLGQVLFTGKDFLVIDFEGEPMRSLSERRLKRSVLRDIAGMIRSFHYAAHSALLLSSSFTAADLTRLQPWADQWYFYSAGLFLQGYLKEVGASPLVPSSAEERKVLLDIFLLDKAIYELGYELNNRPAWTAIPLRGIRAILGTQKAGSRKKKKTE